MDPTLTPFYNETPTPFGAQKLIKN